MNSRLRIICDVAIKLESGFAHAATAFYVGGHSGSNWTLLLAHTLNALAYALRLFVTSATGFDRTHWRAVQRSAPLSANLNRRLSGLVW